MNRLAIAATLALIALPAIAGSARDRWVNCGLQADLQGLAAPPHCEALRPAAEAEARAERAEIDARNWRNTHRRRSLADEVDDLQSRVEQLERR